VTLSSTDGVTLAGWYIPSKNAAAVILLHGYSANRLDMLNHAELLARHGYGVLMYDLRAHGESGGALRSFGWRDVNDVAAALDYMQRRADVDSNRIGLLGFSVGGQIAIRAAAQTDRIKAVVADEASGASSQDMPAPQSLGEWLFDLTDKIALKGIEWRTGTPAPPGVVQVIGNIAPRPILLISIDANDSDHRAIRHYYESAREPKTLWVTSATRHGGSLAAEPAEYESRVVTLFDQALLGK
jgi:pimeloyl-ACP methyl ester carboxylesterase